MPRKPESLFWDRVRPLLVGFHPVRIENAAGLGTPDVNCTLGWIELKQVKTSDIPKRASTVLHLDHFTNEQRIFLLKRAEAGGACWLLMLLGDEWLLFTGRTAADHVGRENVETTRRLAARIWPKTPTAEEFIRGLKETSIACLCSTHGHYGEGKR